MINKWDMDLDNLKKTWQQAEINPTIDEQKIRKMLDNKGQGAFEKLIKYDKLYLWLLIPCALAGVFFFYMHYIPGSIYIALVVIGFFWYRYKLRFLKAINLSEMNILEVSKRVIKYKKFIKYEILFGSVGAVVFFVPYIYYGIPEMMQDVLNDSDMAIYRDTSVFLVTLAIVIVVTFLISFILYKVMYFDNIKQIQKSIKEIEDLERD
jgi:uncharacterized protein YneF (UPF0154 family)